MPSSFQLTLLHPYLACIKSKVEDNDNNCLFGFADTQYAISTAFVYDTIPYMKTIERMTNPCFQEAPFASVMKGKHVLNEPFELDLESDHIKESSGEAMAVEGDKTPFASVPKRKLVSVPKGKHFLNESDESDLESDQVEKPNDHSMVGNEEEVSRQVDQDEFQSTLAEPDEQVDQFVPVQPAEPSGLVD